MQFIESATEQTTAATDLILFLLATWTAFKIRRSGSGTQKAKIWTAVFVLLAVAALFGAIAHGFEMSDKINYLLWQPLNLALGLSVSLFAAAAILDLKSGALPKMVTPLFIALGIIFYFVTVFIPGSFLVFIIYEAIVMLFALVSYIILSAGQRLKGGWWMVAGILITIAAAAIQATDSISLNLIWEFDHNGVFHLVQMVGIIVLLNGLLIDFKSDS